MSGQRGALERERAIDEVLDKVNKDEDGFVELGGMGTDGLERPMAAL